MILGCERSHLIIYDNLTKIPNDPDKLKQVLAKAHRNCQEMELVGLQLEEAISRLESENRERRKQQLEKALQSHNFS